MQQKKSPTSSGVWLELKPVEIHVSGYTFSSSQHLPPISLKSVRLCCTSRLFATAMHRDLLNLSGPYLAPCKKHVFADREGALSGIPANSRTKTRICRARCYSAECSCSEVNRAWRIAKYRYLQRGSSRRDNPEQRGQDAWEEAGAKKRELRAATVIVLIPI